MSIYSYHIFYFPFEWKRKNRKDETFSEQIKLEGIELKPGSCWERVNREPDTEGEKEDFFNERQYYFPFVHPIMYDMKDEESNLMHHYERKEPKMGGVEYRIKIKNREEPYRLMLDSMNLNLYSTGVGVLTLFLANSATREKEDILNINQFGRRIMLPFYGDKDKKEGRQTAESLCITGLEGEGTDYTETFDDITPSKNATWKPAKFITRLISDLSDDIDTDNIHPIIDDRMLVNCWYPNNELAARVKDDKDFIMGDFWYRYIFVDGSSEETCQNDEMKEKLLKESTYQRWQKYGTLYGLTRYSLMALTDEGDFSCNVLAKHMRTIYSRMFELVIVQRASILRFSGEVTKVSKLSNGISHKRKHLPEYIESLYQEYISFANQVYFTYVTAQDQGIEMYDMLMRQFTSADKVKDLDSEIDELYQFVTLIIEREQNDMGQWLNTIATILLPATVVAALLGVNKYDSSYMLKDIIFCVGLAVGMWIFLRIYSNRKRMRITKWIKNKELKK